MRSTDHVWDGKPASVLKFNKNNLTSCSSNLKQTEFLVLKTNTISIPAG
jgi:hypothetical protein